MLKDRILELIMFLRFRRMLKWVYVGFRYPWYFEETMVLNVRFEAGRFDRVSWLIGHGSRPLSEKIEREIALFGG